ncbi:MAG: multicopper oxidase domain-containing protein [Gemmatimonadota bacterium]
MPSLRSVRSSSPLVCAAASLVVACGRPALPVAVTNDQRAPVGQIRNGRLELSLDARQALWYPAAEGGASLVTAAFGETGHAPSVPGPLVRVPVGTTVALTIANTLDDTLLVIGLRDPRLADTLVIPPGARRSASFVGDRPGAYGYHGSTRRNSIVHHRGPGEQLGGVVVVDSAGAPRDRIFVISSWNGTPLTPVTDTPFVMVINGKTWPYTERLRLEMGDTVHWRVLNLAGVNGVHPMHLHGTYFRVDSRGTWRGDTAAKAEDRRMVVTELLEPEQTMSISWTPPRPGRWLFHCHEAFHVAGVQLHDLDSASSVPVAPAAAAGDDHSRAMAGLILGIEVPGADPIADTRPTHRIGLVVQTRPQQYRGNPGIGFALDGPSLAADSIVIPGPLLLLSRNEPTAITVRNGLHEPVSIHWHGIELQSYFDGVPGWSGLGALRAPLIAPGDSFVARFTPPRAGTFIYHSHVSEARHIGSGAYGPLVVLEPGARWDPVRDHILMFGVAGPDDSGSVFVNGGRSPAVEELKAGLTHRLRLINITPGDLVDLEVLQGDSVMTWRVVAKDGADLPPRLAIPTPARLRFGPGETTDVELVTRPGAVRFRVKSFNDFEFASAFGAGPRRKSEVGNRK